MPIKERLTRSPTIRRVYERISRLPMLSAIQSKVARRMIPPGTRVWIPIEEGIAAGKEIQVDPRYEISYVTGEWEHAIQQMLTVVLKPGDTVFDAGAHLGFISLCASILVGDSGRVVALEPDEDSFQRLVSTMKRNKVGNVEPINLAIWKSTGAVPFEPAGGESSRVEGKISSEAPGAGTLSVQATTLDNITDEYGVPALIKMDIEGAEGVALEGAKKLLALKRSTWVIEVHDQANHEACVRQLEENGYSIEPLPTGDPRMQIVARPR